MKYYPPRGEFTILRAVDTIINIPQGDVREVNANPGAMEPNAEGENVLLMKLKLTSATEIDMRGVQEWGNATAQTPVFDRLLRLDTVLEPGLLKAEFQKLFVSCKWCGFVMTKRVFWAHDCKARVGNGKGDSEGDLIDLTGND